MAENAERNLLPVDLLLRFFRLFQYVTYAEQSVSHHLQSWVHRSVVECVIRVLKRFCRIAKEIQVGFGNNRIAYGVYDGYPVSLSSRAGNKQCRNGSNQDCRQYDFGLLCFHNNCIVVQI